MGNGRNSKLYQKKIQRLEEEAEYLFSEGERYHTSGKDANARQCFEEAYRLYNKLRESEVSDEDKARYGRMWAICGEKSELIHVKQNENHDEGYVSPFRSHIDYFTKLEKYEQEKGVNPDLKPPVDNRDMDIFRYITKDLHKKGHLRKSER